MISAEMNVLQIVVDHSHIDRILRAMMAARRFCVDLGTLAAMDFVLVSHRSKPETLLLGIEDEAHSNGNESLLSALVILL